MTSHILFTDDILLEMRDRGVDFYDVLNTMKDTTQPVMDKENQVYNFSSKKTTKWMTVFDCNPSKQPESTTQYGLIIETDANGKQLLYHSRAVLLGTLV